MPWLCLLLLHTSTTNKLILWSQDYTPTHVLEKMTLLVVKPKARGGDSCPSGGLLGPWTFPHNHLEGLDHSLLVGGKTQSWKFAVRNLKHSEGIFPEIKDQTKQKNESHVVGIMKAITEDWLRSLASVLRAHQPSIVPLWCPCLCCNKNPDHYSYRENTNGIPVSQWQS